MAEWLKATDCKICLLKIRVGSNPTLLSWYAFFYNETNVIKIKNK